MSRIAKTIIIILSTVYAIVVASTFVSDRLVAAAFRQGNIAFSLDEKLNLIEKAIELDPFNAELYFKKFIVMQEMRIISGKRKPHKTELYAIKNAIDLRPLWPKYHLYYGLVLEKMSPNPNIITRNIILSQLKKAAELKPYSQMYGEEYLKYLEKYGD
jgi:hypothetical protein